jgi:hypothetical protein
MSKNTIKKVAFLPTKVIFSEITAQNWYFQQFIVAITALYTTIVAHLLTPSYYLIGDTFHYLNMVNGEPAMAPFAYRILTPTIVRWLPWSHETSFFIVSFVGTLTTLIVSYYLFKQITNAPSPALLTMVLLGLSYPISFYLAEFGRVDPLANTLLVAALLMIFRRSFLAASLLIALGVLAKETVLMLLPVLLLSGFTQRPARPWWNFMLWVAIPLVSFALPRWIIQPAPGLFTVRAWNDMITVWQLIWQLNVQEHGLILRLGRDLIRTFGYFWVTALFGFLLLRSDLRWLCSYLFVVGLGLCLVATDWSRMLGAVFPAIFIPTAIFFNHVQRRYKSALMNILLIICAVLQSHLSFYQYSQLNDDAQRWLLISTLAVFSTGALLVLTILRPGAAPFTKTPRPS